MLEFRRNSLLLEEVSREQIFKISEKVGEKHYNEWRRGGLRAIFFTFDSPELINIVWNWDIEL